MRSFMITLVVATFTIFCTDTASAQDKEPDTYVRIIQKGGDGQGKESAIIQIKGLKAIAVKSAKVKTKLEATSTSNLPGGIAEMTFSGRQVTIVKDLAQGCGQAQFRPSGIPWVTPGVTISIPRDAELFIGEATTPPKK